MPDPDAESRQRRQDREYLGACRSAGIEPDAAKYRASSVADEHIDRMALEDDGIRHNGSTYTVARDAAPLEKLTPAAEGAARLLEIILPSKADPATFVKTAGRRCLALAWLLGRRPESLADLARGLGITRASLSVYARALEDKLHVHGRGQKRASARGAYSENARRIWKTRRLDTLMADALGE